MKIGMLGCGLMGSNLGILFAKAGHEVLFPYSRSPNKLKQLTKAAGGKARAATPKEAAEECELLFLAVNWAQIEEVLTQAGDLAGKLIVSCCLPMNPTNDQFLIGHTDSGMETLARKYPSTRFVPRPGV